ncbi:hypothetical protein [Actinoplanes teichomyceticus]|uniref:hypothetical protein n=1 Tax=Actinoplanes teichomyceticus TaxID=1867 RepID=UPI003CC814BF
MAAAAAFLRGPDASYVAGTDLAIDGGVSAAGRTARPVRSRQTSSPQEGEKNGHR